MKGRLTIKTHFFEELRYIISLCVSNIYLLTNEFYPQGIISADSDIM